MKLIRLSIMCLLCIVVAACDEVAKEDRIIYIEPPTVNRPLLIEDFTGQNCVNCPEATDALHLLQKEYGEDNIIVVGIHSGPFGHEAGPAGINGPRLPLCTETGDKYYTHWGISAQPGLIFNRDVSNVVNDPAYIPLYANYYIKDVLTPTQLNMTVKGSRSGQDMSLTITATTDKPVKGKLQVWIVEDNVKGFQLKKNGIEDKDYVHQHVFRTSLTDDYLGRDVVLPEATTNYFTYTYTVNKEWKMENLSVIAFIYNEDGVQQITKAPFALIED